MAFVVLAEPAAAFLKALGADIRATILRKLHDLETEPERRGKALAGDLAAYRSIRAAGKFSYTLYQRTRPSGKPVWYFQTYD